MICQFCQKSCSLPPTGPSEGATGNVGRGGGAVVGTALPSRPLGMTSQGRDEGAEKSDDKSVPAMRMRVSGERITSSHLYSPPPLPLKEDRGEGLPRLGGEVFCCCGGW